MGTVCCYQASIGLSTKHTTHDNTISTLDVDVLLHFSSLPLSPLWPSIPFSSALHLHNTVRVISRVSSIDGSTGYHHNLTTMAPPAALPPLPFNPARVRSYILRIPLFTRLVLLATIAFWVLELQTLWSVVKWGSLAPDEIGLGSSMFPFSPF